MRRALLSIRDRMDRMGIVLSGLCVVHCLAGLVLVSVLGLGGEALLAPVWHRVGLALAIVVGAVGIGLGVLRHGRLAPLAIAAVGLSAMGGALVVSHGPREAALTVFGVLLVGIAHILNLRHAH
jgi:hypothetical protein